MEVLMALAKKLFERLKEKAIEIDQVFLTNLENWAQKQVNSHEETKDLADKAKSIFKAGGGVSGLLKVFSLITAVFKYDYTYKQTLRLVTQNNLAKFVENFNLLLAATEAEIQKVGLGKKLLFMVDGTDRLCLEKSKQFFISDSPQLKSIQSNCIYSAPIDLLYTGSQVKDIFSVFVLPMVEIRDELGRERLEEVYKTLRRLVLKRINRQLFDSEKTINYLIDYSGGNLGHLVMLLKYAFLSTETYIFDRQAAEKAVKSLTTDFRRLLYGDKYKLLYQIDRAKNHEEYNSEKTRWLLHNLALLEYNEYWRVSHPVIRGMQIYQDMENETD